MLVVGSGLMHSVGVLFASVMLLGDGIALEIGVEIACVLNILILRIRSEFPNLGLCLDPIALDYHGEYGLCNDRTPICPGLESRSFIAS